MAYQRIEPVWKGFELGVPAAWARAMTYWCMRPPRAQQAAMRAMAQARLVAAQES